jgi:hypothetical protein
MKFMVVQQMVSTSQQIFIPFENKQEEPTTEENELEKEKQAILKLLEDG